MDLFYTYIWRDAAGVPFYVGKGKKQRAKAIGNHSADFKAEYAKGGCILEIVDEFIHEPDAHAHEVELIALYGRRDLGGLLVNKTDGGEGASGVVFTDERRANISAALMGRELSPDHAANIGNALRGKPKSPDHKEKAAIAGRAPNVVAKKVAATMRRHADPKKRMETIAKLRMAGPRKDNTSGYKGVSLDQTAKKWSAHVQIGGRRKSLGHHRTAEQAARAYDAACLAAFGLGNCYLNFPPQAANDNLPLPQAKAA